VFCWWLINIELLVHGIYNSIRKKVTFPVLESLVFVLKVVTDLKFGDSRRTNAPEALRCADIRLLLFFMYVLFGYTFNFS